MTNTYNISVDFCINNHVVVRTKQYDKGRIFYITCTANGDAINLKSSDCVCELKILLPNEDKLFESININDDGIIEYELKENILSESGKASFEVVLSNAETNQSLSSMPIALIIEPSVF